jgi:hypothetical protein
MDQPAKPFTSEGTDTRKWIGRIMVAVILGEAIWGLIVSFMNHVFVPWLGDVMGQSSGLPTSFTQRPYNYPELFVSVFEFCIAGLVAAVINYFFQRPVARRGTAVKSSVPAAPLGPIRVVPQAPSPVLVTETAPPQFGIAPAPPPMPSPVQDARAYPVIPSILIPADPAPPVPPAPVPEARPAAVVPPVAAVASPVVATPVAAKPAPPPPKVEPAKPKKPKNVYYNIVGEPMPSDDD